MNIHFTEEHNLTSTLDSLTVFRTAVGSTMYGLETEDSDIDYLSIYVEPTFNRNSLLWEHHQLQYKFSNVDYNYTTLQTFIRNILTGDSTINFEVLFSKELKHSEDLKWLYNYRFAFINYNIIKSYLGLAKRDLKMWRKSTKNGVHTTETNKKLSHFFRGVTIAHNCIKYTRERLNIDLLTHQDVTVLDKDIITFLMDVKTGVYSKDIEAINYAEIVMNSDREELNILLNEGQIEKFMHPVTLRGLDSKVLAYCDNIQSRPSIARIDYKDLFYKDFGKDINYGENLN